VKELINSVDRDHRRTLLSIEKHVQNSVDLIMLKLVFFEVKERLAELEGS
jgi:hypothetical protein